MHPKRLIPQLRSVLSESLRIGETLLSQIAKTGGWGPENGDAPAENAAKIGLSFFFLELPVSYVSEREGMSHF